MKISILNTTCSIKGAKLFAGSRQSWSDADESACKAAIKSAVEEGISAVIVDVKSFVTDKVNRSYVSNSIIECIYELAEEIDLPEDLAIYLAEAASDSEKYAELFAEYREVTVCNNAFGYFDDTIIEDLEKFLSKDEAVQEFRFKVCSIINKLVEDGKISQSSDIYNAAGISRSVYSRITDPRGEERKSLPQKGTVAALCIALKLSLEEADELYKSAGYALIGSPEFLDRVLRYFISAKHYDIDDINACLVYYGHPILGARSREERKDDRDSQHSETKSRKRKINIQVGK